MQINKLEAVKRGFNELVILVPRMLSEAEASAFDERMAEIADADEAKDEKKYRILVDYLAAATVELPQVERKEEDKKTKKTEVKTAPLVENAQTPEAAITTYFADYNPLNAAVANWLYLDIRSQFIPKQSF
jgi:hypothetical protein